MTNDKLKTIYEYNSLGQQIASYNQGTTNGVVQTGLVSGSTTYYEQIDNHWWQTTSSYIWAQTNSANCTTTSVSRTQMTGLGQTAGNAELQLGINANAKCIAFSSSTDLHNNTTTNMTFVDQSTATKWQISQSSLSAGTACQETIAGYPVMTISSLGATNTFTYDGFARQTSSTTIREASAVIGTSVASGVDRRMVSLVTSNFFNTVGQLSSVISEDLTTTYTYNSLGRTVAICSRGQQTSEVSATTNEYNSLGQLVYEHGSTYPVKYEYDTSGRKILMQTFADSNDPAETEWLYDEPTGLLTNKLYDDGNGPSYSYYPNGKLHTRTWARGVTATNLYSVFGELISTSYSDGTPTVTKQYNRLGQPIFITDAQGTRIYAYNTNTFALLSESINGTNTISYFYNSRGIQTGYSSGNAEPQLGISLVTDDYGRPATLQATFGSETNTFHYNYLYGSAMVSSITNNLGFGISKYYEDYRNLIVGVSNYFGSSPISSFEYQNDAVGRRSKRYDSDDNLLVTTNGFAYNHYSEVTNAIMSTNNYNYTMDDIGNRLFLNNDEYTVDNLNQTEYLITEQENEFYFAHDLNGNMIYK